MIYEAYCPACFRPTQHSSGVCLECRGCRNCGGSERQKEVPQDGQRQHQAERQEQPPQTPKATEWHAWAPFSDNRLGSQSVNTAEHQYASGRRASPQGSEQSALGRQTSDPRFADVVAQIGGGGGTPGDRAAGAQAASGRHTRYSELVVTVADHKRHRSASFGSKPRPRRSSTSPRPRGLGYYAVGLGPHHTRERRRLGMARVR